MIGPNLAAILGAPHIKEHIDTFYDRIFKNKAEILTEILALTDADIRLFNTTEERAIIVLCLIAGSNETAELFCEKFNWTMDSIFSAYEGVFKRATVDNTFIKAFTSIDIDEYMKKSYQEIIENRDSLLVTIKSLQKTELLSLRPYYRKSIIVLFVALGGDSETLEKLCGTFNYELTDVLVEFVLSDRGITSALMQFRDFINPEIIEMQAKSGAAGHIFYLTKNTRNFSQLLEYLSSLKEIFIKKHNYPEGLPLSNFFENSVAGSYTFKRQLRHITLTRADWSDTKVQNLFSSSGFSEEDVVISILESIHFEDFDILLEVMAKVGIFEMKQRDVAAATPDQILKLLDIIENSHVYRRLNQRPDFFHSRKISNIMSHLWISNQFTKQILQLHWDKVAIFLSDGEYRVTEEIFKSCNVSLKEALIFMGR